MRDHPEYMAAVRRNYRWNYAAIIVDGALFSLVLSILSQTTILPYFVSRLTERAFLVSLVSTLNFLGFFFPQLAGAYMVHGTSRRKPNILLIATLERVGILLLALSARVAGVLQPGWALAVFFAAYSLFSATTGLISPAYGDFVAKNIPWQRGMLYGLQSVLGGSLGLAGAYVVKHILQSYPFAINFEIAFWLAFVLSFTSLMVIASFREVPQPWSAKSLPVQEYVRSTFSLLPEHRHFSSYLFVRAIMSLGSMGVPLASVFGVGKFALGSGDVGLFTILVTASQMAATFLLGWVGDHYGYKVVLMAATALSGLQALATILAPSASLFYLAFVFMGASLGATYLAEHNLVFEISPPTETPRFIGLANTALAPFLAGSSLLGGYLADLFSYETVFILSAGLSFVILVFIALVFVEPRKKGKSPSATELPDRLSVSRRRL